MHQMLSSLVPPRLLFTSWYVCQKLVSGQSLLFTDPIPVLLFVLTLVFIALTVFLFSHYFQTVSSRPAPRPSTRGTDSNTLVVPFLPDPSGRKSIRFVSAVAWNSLPAHIRTLDNCHGLQSLLYFSVADHNMPLFWSLIQHCVLAFLFYCVWPLWSSRIVFTFCRINRNLCFSASLLC